MTARALPSLPLFDAEPLMAVKVPDLRPYQEKAIKLARMHVVSGKKRILMTGPCGSGKTVVLSAIIRTSTVPVLFVCHRMELIDQTCEQLARQGITNVGVIRADDPRTNPNASVQVASIQTLARRDKPKAGIVICDEAHRTSADSWINHVFTPYRESIILGFTASPCRNDGRPLDFEELVVFATYQELFKRSDWLIEPDSFSSPKIDLSSVPISHGDYQETALGEVMSQHTLVGNLLDHWMKMAGRHPVCAADTMKPIPGAFTEGERRRTFIFAVNIAHSKLICSRFAAAGVRIAHLDGTTPEDIRKSTLAALRAGELECVSNCNLFLEGVDMPEVKCVVHARPTQSLVLWLQSATRMLRPWKGVRPLLLDHAGNWDRHGPPHEDRVWSLTNVAARRASAPPMKLCKQCFAYVSLGAYVCPYCKYFFQREEMVQKMPTESSEILQMRDATLEVVRREFFDKMVTVSRVRGFRPGFASAKHRDHYKEWPPRAWIDEIKAAYASDPGWQERVETRLRRKELEEKAWDGTSGDYVDPAMAVGSDPSGLAATYVADAAAYAEEETFADWVERTIH
jgi:DNA repair protein RadD